MLVFTRSFPFIRIFIVSFFLFTENATDNKHNLLPCLYKFQLTNPDLTAQKHSIIYIILMLYVEYVCVWFITFVIFCQFGFFFI